MKTLLTNWRFAAGEDPECLKAGREVLVPHTWNTEDSLQHYVGKGWYATTLPPCPAPFRRTFLCFRGAYRDAAVYVNGHLAGTHEGSGYTPFMLEITEQLNPDADSQILVSVDNRFSENALPFGRSFDWANDGGLYRPVECLRTGRILLRDVTVTAQPVIPPTGERQRKGQGFFGFRPFLDGARPGDCLRWALHAGADDSMIPMADDPLQRGTLSPDESLAPRLLQDMDYWHFDRPCLYTLRLQAFAEDGQLSDERDVVFGFREMKRQGEKWFLNGEAVRLPGMEWMPGSDPEKGMAESKADLERMLALLKESNSVLTRFHWQQDDWVYDWCDRHGLLVQEEIPFWGKQPEGDPETLRPVIEAQLTEMITAHRHHPSIIAWGVGNELSGQEESVQRYVRWASAYARALDETRLTNYVTNTAWENDFQDAAKDGDILCINDYIGTWHTGLEQESAWQSLLSAHPGRAFIPSEFGLCEPAFSGGDPAREKIFLEKMDCYRPKTQIAGTVYFCLNDYRTHMGEEGDGKLRRRVHGSAGLKGEKKPSYDTVKREHSPLTARWTEKGLLLTCREDLPRYAVQGYSLQTAEARIDIPDLLPGESWLCEILRPGEPARVCRPTGDEVITQ